MSVPGRLLRDWNEQTFDREVLNFPGRAVVMFGEPSWSTPCHWTRRALLRLAPEFPTTLTGVVSVSEALAVCRRLWITVTPTIIVFEAGREVRRIVGTHTDEVWRKVLGGQGSGASPDG